MVLAPVVLFVYNRPEHTLKTLEALKANPLAKDSVLFVFSDGPKQNAADSEREAIAQVRRILREKDWCGKVEILERKENYGLAKNIIDGITGILAQYEKVIVLEDDLITGKYFLNFMNESLAVYKDEIKVFGISGYKYPSTKDIKDSTYFLPIASSWSFATWKDRWDRVSFNGKELLEQIDSQRLGSKLNFGGNPFYEMLEEQVELKNDSWAIRFYVSMFLENAFFLYPNQSLIKNIGFDNSGVHCGVDDYYSKAEVSNKKIEVVRKRIELKKGIVNKVKKSFNARFYKENSQPRIKNVALKLLRRMNLI